MDSSPPGKNFPDKNTGVGSISYAKGSSPPKDQPWVSFVSCIGRQILYHWATKEASHVPL